MASAVARELKFTWGTFVVGGTTEREIHGPFSFEWDYTGFRVSFNVLVRADTEALFTSACDTFEDEFRKREQRFLMELGSSTIRDFNTADGSAIDTAATCSVAGDLDTDTGRSRMYQITITGQLTADDLDGRRDNKVMIHFDAARRAEVTYSGTWTAVGTDSASTKYLAESPAWMASMNSSFLSSRTMKLVDEVYTPDRNDDVLEFSVTWRELIATGTASALNDANITDQTISMRLNRPAPGDSGEGIVRLRDCTVQWECAVNAENVVDLDTLWTGTILPYIDGQVQAVFGASQVARVNVDAGYITSANRIQATVVYRLAIGATDVIESRITTGYADNPGLDFTPVHSSTPTDCYVDQGPQIPLRFVERRSIVLGVISAKSKLGGGGDVFGIGGAPGANPGSGLLDPEPAGSDPVEEGWNLVPPVESRATVIYIGEGDYQFPTTVIEERWAERYVTRPPR